MDKRYFGTLPDGTDIYEYTICDGNLTLSVLDFGAIVRTLTVFGVDVAGGFDELCDYIVDDSHQGGTIGRVANRIGGAKFTIDGVEYRLPKNNGENCLHGGVGFDRRVWTVASHEENEILLEYCSTDGEEGFPGELYVRVSYRLENDALIIKYLATPEKKTPISLTNHTYFNLNGFGGDVLSHKLAVYADRYTAVDGGLIPTGERPEVAKTPFDLRRPTALSLPVSVIAGIDHNFILSREAVGTLKYGRVRHAATLTGDSLEMQVYTSCEGVQVYTGNFLGYGPDFKGGVKQVKHGAVCLEAQSEPNCINHGREIFDAGETYRQTTVYEFHQL